MTFPVNITHHTDDDTVQLILKAYQGETYFLSTGGWDTVKVLCDDSELISGWGFSANPDMFITGFVQSHVLPIRFVNRSELPIEIIRIHETEDCPGALRDMFLYKETPGEINAEKTVFQQIFLGFMIALILYNVFIGFTSSDKSYFLFAAFLTGFSLLWLAVNGFGFIWFWPHHPVWNKFSLWVMVVLQCLLFVEFTRSYLGLKVNAPGFIHYINAFQVLTIVWLIIALAFRHVRLLMVEAYSLPFVFYLLLIPIFIKLYFSSFVLLCLRTCLRISKNNCFSHG